jgi:hypothetical protein
MNWKFLHSLTAELKGEPLLAGDKIWIPRSKKRHAADRLMDRKRRRVIPTNLLPQAKILKADFLHNKHLMTAPHDPMGNPLPQMDISMGSLQAGGNLISSAISSQASNLPNIHGRQKLLHDLYESL